MSPELDERFAWEVLLGRDRTVNAFTCRAAIGGQHCVDAPGLGLFEGDRLRKLGTVEVLAVFDRDSTGAKFDGFTSRDCRGADNQTQHFESAACYRRGI